MVSEEVASRPFTIADILDKEASSLCIGSPHKTKTKEPSGSTSELTQLAKRGEGDAHCVVRSWPNEETPTGWGKRNNSLLEIVNLESLHDTDPDPNVLHLVNRIKTSRIPRLRLDDDGNEEVYRSVAEAIVQRTTALACFFFISQWNKAENSCHPDALYVKQTLSSFEVLSETTSKDSIHTIRKDIGVHIIRNPPIPIVKKMYGTSSTTMMFSINTKSPGNVDYPHQGLMSPTFRMRVETVDQAMDLCLKSSESEPKSIKQLTKFLKTELRLEWPQIATSHFAQVFIYFLHNWHNHFLEAHYNLDGL